MKKTLPQYIRRGHFALLPYRDKQGRLQLWDMTYMLPWGDIAEMGQAGPARFLQNPLISTAYQLAYNKNYSGNPIYYDWEHPATKAAKTLGFLWEMWSPAPMPGNIDWKTLWDAIQEQPEALSPEEAVASQFGFRLTSVDPTRMKRRSEALRRIHETEISTEMRKELKRTKNAEEISEVLDHYRKLRLEQREP